MNTDPKTELKVIELTELKVIELTELKVIELPPHFGGTGVSHFSQEFVRDKGMLEPVTLRA